MLYKKLLLNPRCFRIIIKKSKQSKAVWFTLIYKSHVQVLSHCRTLWALPKHRQEFFLVVLIKHVAGVSAFFHNLYIPIMIPYFSSRNIIFHLPPLFFLSLPFCCAHLFNFVSSSSSSECLSSFSITTKRTDILRQRTQNWEVAFYDDVWQSNDYISFIGLVQRLGWRLAVVPMFKS